MPDLRLTLCSRPFVHVGPDSDLAPALPAKSLALLAFLAIERGPQARERLGSLLWGESTEAKSSASLRQCLSQLRSTLGDHLRVTRATVELDARVSSDVGEFLGNLTRDPDAALAIDIPQFLAGFTIRQCPGFEEWLEATRSILVASYLRAIGTAAREAAARQDHHRAAEWAERWLRADPGSEEAAHQLIDSRYLAGDVRAALDVYSRFRARLMTEEGREPTAALRALVQPIREGRPRASAPGPAYREEDAIPALGFALTGRAREWSTMVAAWEAVRQGNGRVVLIEGESGSGKSRLVEDFGRLVRAGRGRVLLGRTFGEAVAVPFGPMLEVLREALKAPGAAGTDPAWLAEIARLLPEVRRQFPSLPDPHPAPGNSLLFEAVAELLLAETEDQPLMVVIEDLQWCDQESCALINHLVRRMEQSPVLWCLTLTPGELRRDAPASRLVRVLRASQSMSRLILAPLGAEEIWSMIQEVGHVEDAVAGERLATRLHDVTGGNPFYVIELLKTLFAEGWLTVDEATRQWLVPGPAEDGRDVLPMSRTVQDAIAQRVARLPDELHAILHTLALVSGGCSTAVLSHVHGISRLRAAVDGDELVERFLAVEDGRRYRCAHPIIADVVRIETSGARRREIHRVLAAAMLAVAQSGDEPLDAGAIARHAEQAGERGVAFEHALLASDAAQERADYDEALSWLDLAASCADGVEQAAVVDLATAKLLLTTGWSAPPAGFRRLRSS
ncbi:MAG: AAA family ATPase [Gemmatimonadota bacterium]